ncbi:VPLPA-CTERM sorting domain-containing protein [Methylomonas sp. CM2]|uniref:VPLPA-CTERM sorting domain-containing protein n=1 Tax=Methylomonas sp. CM2 TaxID=3417647 RepID=UPI003CF98843
MQNLKSIARTVLAASVITLSLPASAEADVMLSGYLKSGSPASFSIADLQAFGAATSVTVGGNTYTGVSLYSYLNSYVATQPNSANGPKNDLLREFVVATGNNGSAVYTMGNQLGGNFGGAQDIIAFQDSNGVLAAPSLIAADGASVTSLTSLDVGHVAWQGTGSGGIANSFTVGGAVSNPGSYSLANLPGSLIPITTFSNLATGSATGFTGVSMWDLLVASGISTNPSSLKTSYVVATATDNYTVVYSLGEILARQASGMPDLIAYADGIGSGLGSAGVFRTIIPGDTRGGRYMSNLSSLTVVNAVPLPAAAWMMLSGVLGLAFQSRKRVIAA